MSRHIATGCYDRNPVWVPVTQEQVLPLMGKTKAEQMAAREAWRKLYGPPIAPKRRRSHESR